MTESAYDYLARRYAWFCAWFANKVTPAQFANLVAIYGDDFQRTRLNPLTYHYKE